MTGAAMLTDTTTPAFSVENIHVSDSDLPAFTDMPFEDIEELHLDHPGASDQEYRTRRDYIASLSKKFRETGVITDVDYNEQEQGIWRHVAARLEELHQKHASPFYLKAKRDLGISNDRIPQLSLPRSWRVSRPGRARFPCRNRHRHRGADAD